MNLMKFIHKVGSFIEKCLGVFYRTTYCSESNLGEGKKETDDQPTLK